MQIEITPNSQPEKPKLTYPAMMQWIGDTDNPAPLVVLFIDERHGSKLKATGFERLSNHWEPASSADYWQPFIGTLTFTP